jgi:hypothetical protein
MNAVNTAIYSTLSGSSSVTNLLANATSIYHQIARDNAPFDYIVFNKQSGTEPNDTRHRVHDLIYQVRAFSKTSTKAALAIDAQVDALLHNQTLSITGYAQLRLLRIGDIEFVEAEPNTEKVYSAGGLYRVRLEKTS